MLYLWRRSKMRRPDKSEYYLRIARDVSTRGTCIRRNYGAVIVQNDEIIATGYTGVPRGQRHYTPDTCPRELAGAKKGERYDLCRSVHAEQNAIISAARRDMLDADMYLAGIDDSTGLLLSDWPCDMCKRIILNAGIGRVHIVGEQPLYPIVNWVQQLVAV
jgi:dCMP deaminase